MNAERADFYWFDQWVDSMREIVRCLDALELPLSEKEIDQLWDAMDKGVARAEKALEVLKGLATGDASIVAAAIGLTEGELKKAELELKIPSLEANYPKLKKHRGRIQLLRLVKKTQGPKGYA
jgi:glutathione S-transferase